MSKAQGGEGAVAEDGLIVAEVEKIGKSTRRVRAKVTINASLEAVWSVLTDYDKWSDIIPGLTLSKLLEKKGNCARVEQTGQRSLPLGIKLSAKLVLEYNEKEVEVLATVLKRELEFKMIEGNFQTYEGKWSIEQVNKPKSGTSLDQEFESILSYTIDVKPNAMVPLHLIEGRISNDVKTNLSCVREAAVKRMGKSSTV